MKQLRLPLCTHRFTLSGLNLERFMNTMQKEGVPLLSLKRVDARTLHCECYTSDLMHIRTLADEKGWRMTEACPTQLSAFLHSLRTRPGLPIGMLLALVMMMVLMQFVWRIDIHNAGAYQADIAQFLQDEGYIAGTRRSAIDAAELERKLTRRYPDIAWFHVYVYHVTLVVDVTQGVPMPLLPSAEAGDVVAARGGVVDSIRVFAGTPQVKAGDVVVKGQVLISGVERGRDEALVPVQARGVVMARCWRSHTVEMPLYEVTSAETGRESVATRIATPWLSVPADLDSPPFLAYNTYVRHLPVVGSFFPVRFETVTRREVSLEYVPRDESEVRTEAASAALQKLQTALYGYELIDKWVDYCMIEGTTLAATATAEWLMDIGENASP